MQDALNAFRARAKKAAPTLKHRAVLWECMLGTVYAASPAGEVRYFDYDYDEALQFAGSVTDVRVARHDHRFRTGLNEASKDSYMRPRVGKLVWYGVDAQPTQGGAA